MPENLLSIQNLEVCVNDVQIINGLSLEINVGEVHAIMGRNGSGKSTLSKVIAGHPAYKVTSGKVTFQGKNLFFLVYLL